MAIFYTADEIMFIGLELVGFSLRRQSKVTTEKNVMRFKAHYGSIPQVCAQIWEDLQFTELQEARINPKAKEVNRFLMAMHWLYCYPTEPRLEATFQICDRTARDSVWEYARRVQALKEDKIVWPPCWNNANDEGEVFIVSVDGTHCRVREPTHARFSKNPKFYSHKFNQAGLNYELGLSVYQNRLVWMNGPFPAGVNDITVFREMGLKDKVPHGKKVVGDNGYIGESGVISTPNSHDPEELRKFKSRARARHESFNSRLKNFACLGERFRHGIHKHKIAFEAVCVICQYQLDFGSQLFEV